MRALKRSLVVLPIAAALTLVGTAAYAFDWSSIGWDEGATSSGSRTFFENDGEHLYILDNNKDGHSAVSEINYGSRHLTYWNHSGVDTTRDVNLDIAEGVHVDYNACYGEYGDLTIVGCGYWVGATS
ncbi:hypothetical protein [Streptomyces sp. NBC_00328]|uniref:hypothetical protein n=1 Tax=Streptomyces sp. NBC_00328 TaxID=2903646 RepID=UPI002E29602F|nr:hypothetical protein [Streptomyces sp. NBC_00328]